MLNPIFWKKVQGQKHPGRWGIVEHQLPSIKVWMCYILVHIAMIVYTYIITYGSEPELDRHCRHRSKSGSEPTRYGMCLLYKSLQMIVNLSALLTPHVALQILFLTTGYLANHRGWYFPKASCQIRKIVGCVCTGNAGNVFPATVG